MINFKTKIMQRKEVGWVETKKKAPPVRMGKRLMAHLKRWQRMDGKAAVYVVNYRGTPIMRLDDSWQHARELAGLSEHITPHVLRHSRATHMMQQRVDPWEASNALGMSLE